MIKQKFLMLAVFSLLMSSLASLMYAPPTQAACGGRFLTMPSWYRGLTDGNCNIDVNAAGSGSQDAKLTTFIQILALNIVEIMMHIVSYVCVAFIIVGGFKYMTSSGSPDGNTKGRQTIQNAVIGLVISIASIGIINFIANGAI